MGLSSAVIINTQMGNNIIYPDEDDVLQLRKGFKLALSGYLSRGSFLYILDTIRGRYNEESFPDALAAKAAYLLFNIVVSHPFVDGNKRTAYGTADIFLRLNSYYLDVSPKSGVEFIVRVANGEVNDQKVRKWVGEHLKKLDS
jgi:death-on-curing protein